VIEPELLEIVEKSGSMVAACSTLVDLANERGGEDNITVVVADVSGEDLSKAARDERDETLEIIQEFVPFH
jgi:protein phosphatase